MPRIIVGAWQLSEGHHVERYDQTEVVRAFQQMADAGFTAFDGADIYTGVEELLGALLHQTPGQAIRLHTKFVPDREALPRISKTYTERIIDRSLMRLGVDQLDLVQFGWWDYTVPQYVETAQWLHELQTAGKIRLLGATNFDTARLREIVEAGVPLIAHQVQYSLLDQRPEGGMIDLCRDHGVHLLCYGTLAGGFLTERWLHTTEPTEPLGNRSLTKYKLIIDEFGGWDGFQELLSVVHTIAGKHDVSMSAVSTRYILDRPQVGAAIVGARNARHLPNLIDVLSLTLDDDDLGVLDAATANRGPAGDVFDLERDYEGRHGSIMRYNLNRDATDAVTARDD